MEKRSRPAQFFVNNGTALLSTRMSLVDVANGSSSYLILTERS